MIGGFIIVDTLYVLNSWKSTVQHYMEYFHLFSPFSVYRPLSQSRSSVRGSNVFLGASNKRAKLIVLQIEKLKDQVGELDSEQLHIWSMACVQFSRLFWEKGTIAAMNLNLGMIILPSLLTRNWAMLTSCVGGACADHLWKEPFCTFGCSLFRLTVASNIGSVK